MEENKKDKIKLENVIIYGNENCPYCKNVKAEFEKHEIEFESKDTTEFEDEWNDIVGLTTIPTVPTIKYKDNYFVPGRDFHNPMNLVQILSTYKPSVFDTQTRVLERLTSLNFHFSQSVNNMYQQIVEMNNKISELHSQLIENLKTEKENEHESTN